jgi:hypothetical protein
MEKEVTENNKHRDAQGEEMDVKKEMKENGKGRITKRRT